MPKWLREQLAVLLEWPLLSFFILQVSLIIAWEFHSPIVLIVTGIVFASLAFLHVKTQNTFRFLIFCLILILSLSFQKFLQNPLSQNLTFKKAQYLARVLTNPEFADQLTRITVDLTQRENPVPQTVSGRIRLTISGSCDFTPGSLIRFSGTVKSPQSYKNPGGFDYKSYLRWQNIWAKSFLPNCEAIQVLSTRPLSWIERTQQRFSQDFQNPNLKNGPLLNALLFGTRTIDQDQKDFFKTAGLSHLFAISGMNFAIMSALIYGLVVFLTGFFAKLYLHIPKQKLAAIFTIGFIAYYLLIVTPQPSLLRSGIMMICYLAAILFERQKHLLHIILLSALVLLVFRPLDLFDLSFQLSYLCVLILALILPVVQSLWEGQSWFAKSPKILTYFLQIFFTSWLLQVLLLPLMLLEFGKFNLAGLINNLWAIPFFDFVLVPLSLFYFLSFSLYLPFTKFILLLWDHTLTWFLQVAQIFSHIPYPQFNLPTPHTEQLFIFYGLLFLFFLTKKKFILPVMTVFLTLTSGWIYYQNHLSFDLRLTQIDVGQGDSILIQTPNKNLLIDTGGHLYLDLASQALMPYFRYMGVDHLDTVVITHADLDHYGSMSSLLDQIKVGEVWINDKETKEGLYQDLLQKIQSLNIPLKHISKEEVINFDEHLQIHALSPTPDFAEFDDDNDHSIVLQLVSESEGREPLKILLTGDLSKKGEKILVRDYGELLQSQVLKVGHHGSHNSTSKTFLKFVNPEYATIGVGEHSRFGHPSPEVIGNLKEAGIAYGRTDLDGAIEISWSGEKRRQRVYENW